MFCLPRQCSVDLNLFRAYFVDLRFICVIMSLWLMIVIVVFVDLEGLSKSDSAFFHFGPRASLMFFHTPIDTYAKYNALICLIIAHTAISDCLSDSLNPHVLTIVQNRTNRYLPHSKGVYYVITSIWSIYCAVSSLFTIYLAFGQIDLLLVRLLSDMAANIFTMNMYMQGKIYDAHMYNETVAHETHNFSPDATAAVSLRSTNRNQTDQTDDVDCISRDSIHLIAQRMPSFSVESSDDESMRGENVSRKSFTLQRVRPIVGVSSSSNAYYAVQDIMPQPPRDTD